MLPIPTVIPKNIGSTYIIIAIAVFGLLGPSQADAYVHVLQVGVHAGYFFHRDAGFKDVYGNGNLTFGSKAALRLIEGFHLTGGMDFLKTKGTIPQSEFNAEASQRNISAGLAYFFELSYSWEFRLGGDLVYVDYEESAFGEKIEDNALAYRIEGALMWRVSKDIFSEIQVSYTHGSDEIEDRTINIGGFQVGVGLSFRF